MYFDCNFSNRISHILSIFLFQKRCFYVSPQPKIPKFSNPFVLEFIHLLLRDRFIIKKKRTKKTFMENFVVSLYFYDIFLLFVVFVHFLYFFSSPLLILFLWQFRRRRKKPEAPKNKLFFSSQIGVSFVIATVLKMFYC